MLVRDDVGLLIYSVSAKHSVVDQHVYIATADLAISIVLSSIEGRPLTDFVHSRYDTTREYFFN